jgi:hypothetical protein
MEMGLVKGSLSLEGTSGGTWDYMLLAHPDDMVAARLMEEKLSFCKEYGLKAATKTRPYITVASFSAFERMEETMIRWLHRIIGNNRSFHVSLNNYSGIPAHTIYLRVQDHAPFQNLVSQLSIVEQYVKSNGCAGMNLMHKPHLNIARGLPEGLYEKALIDYSQRTFHDSFMVNELHLIKRKDQFENSRRVAVFPLFSMEKNMFN